MVGCMLTRHWQGVLLLLLFGRLFVWTTMMRERSQLLRWASIPARRSRRLLCPVGRQSRNYHDRVLETFSFLCEGSVFDAAGIGCGGLGGGRGAKTYVLWFWNEGSSPAWG